MTEIPSDVRYAVRRWLERPMFAAAAIATLTLGIGATSAIFSVVDSVVLQPLPWYAADRLVTVHVARPQWRTDPVLAPVWDRGTLSWPMFRDLQQANGVFEAVGTYGTAQVMLDGDQSELVASMQVSASFLSMLGVRPVRGRFFTDEEDDAPGVAILIAWEAWQRRFGGADDVIGRRLSIDSTTRTIVGVVPPGFRFGSSLSAEVYLPWGNLAAGAKGPGNHFMQGVARLRPGVSVEHAQSASAPLVTGTEPPDRKTSRIQRLSDQQLAGLRRPLLIVFAAAIALLLVGCSNVAGLLLGEAATRRHEMAVRAALGATRLQIARRLFVESVLLAIVAAAAGLLLAYWITPTLVCSLRRACRALKPLRSISV